MGLAMSTRRELTEDLARRYRQASKKEKGVILDQFVQTTGYQRKYAIQLLNWWGRSRLVWIDGKPVKLVVGRRRRRKRRARPRRYDRQVLKALKQIWYVFDFMCGKRLVVVLRTMLPRLESFGEIQVSPEVRAKLLTISAATIDRLRAPERNRLYLKGRSRTKPGTLLKHQIPIRTSLTGTSRSRASSRSAGMGVSRPGWLPRYARMTTMTRLHWNMLLPAFVSAHSSHTAKRSTPASSRSRHPHRRRHPDSTWRVTEAHVNVSKRSPSAALKNDTNGICASRDPELRVHQYCSPCPGSIKFVSGPRGVPRRWIDRQAGQPWARARRERSGSINCSQDLVG